MDWKVPLGILLLPLIALGIVYTLAYYNVETPLEISFSHDGNLIRDNPGLEPNTWYLSFDEPGAPGRLVQLVFDHGSRCGTKENLRVCDMSFEQGERVHIEGAQKNNLVLVVTLEEVH